MAGVLITSSAASDPKAVSLRMSERQIMLVRRLVIADNVKNGARDAHPELVELEDAFIDIERMQAHG